MAIRMITGRIYDLNVPVVVNFRGREPVLEDDVGDDPRESHECDHAGATWSSCLVLRCIHCGAKLFMPPRYLAYKTTEELDAMYRAWEEAGSPPWGKNGWPAGWVVEDHPLFP